MGFKISMIAGAALAFAFNASAANVYPADVVAAGPFNWSTGGDGLYNTTDDFNNQWGQIDLRAGGTAEVTGDYPRSGNGSLKLASNGDASAKAGVAYYPPTQNGFGPLSSITAASFDYMRVADSADNTPIMRLFLFAPNTDTHLVTVLWEPSINGVTVTNGTWATADVLNGTVRTTKTNQAAPFSGSFASLASDPAYQGLIVRAVEIGFGSGGWSGAFVGAADNVVITGSVTSVTSNFEMAPPTFNVTIDTGADGSSVPAAGVVQAVDENDTLAVAYTPATGFEIDTVTGCGGALSGTTYTTAAVTADCTVTASFKAVATPPITAVPPTATTSVPTLSQWGVMLLGLLTAGVAALRLRRRG
ncbi:IPTL-CTERM sorting domain-containing protein [Diaphorobacter caeni]|uniref:IPTL-CTERM sorting domain-containing protein n=1 Tax=Diaphorobacter caeni TaxID=2784387 RepID=UPI00188F959A|nr:IPTL-CTERM sorting domain-containing protein [Diaphorobacter caeni]MBF5004851.1 IPTL-CTERM sorting domain-containing protein [Diaphorobacter caeni]